MSDSRELPGRSGSGDLVKVTFYLPEEERSESIESERLWAESLGGGRYRLDNVPFFIYGVSFGDIVSAEEVEGALIVREVVSPSGHSTYRVFPRGHAVSSAAVEERLAALRALGAILERANPKLIAVDVPPDVDIDAIYRVLEDGEDVEGLWTLDQGHYGRP